MKILITGARGQLGTALQRSLEKHDLEPLSRADLDISNRLQVQEKIRVVMPDLVINTAAYTQVDQAESDSAAAYEINESGAAYLAESASDLGIPVVHISTDYVFDGHSNHSWLESDDTHPLSVYGKSKLAGEQAVIKHNPRHYIVRTAWLYHYSGNNFLRTMFGLKDRDEVRVVDDQKGSPTNADDLADALAQLIETGKYGIHHLVNQGETSWYGLACEFYRQLGIATRIVPVKTEEFPRPAPRPASSVLHTRQDTGIALPGWKQGVARLVEQIKHSGW